MLIKNRVLKIANTDNENLSKKTGPIDMRPINDLK